jgi:hypothetical protein
MDVTSSITRNLENRVLKAYSHIERKKDKKSLKSCFVSVYTGKKMRKTRGKHTY